MKISVRILNNFKYIFISVCLFAMLFCNCTGEYTGVSELYTIEKMFYKAERAQQNILINPDIATKSDYAAAEEAYRDIIIEFGYKANRPKEVRNYVRQSWMAIGKLCRLQQEHAKAIEVYQEIIKKASGDKELCAIAQFAIANSQERMGMIDDAIASYQKLVDEYSPVLADTLLPNIDILQTPNYIARIYRQQNKNILAEEQYEKSRRYLQRIIQKYPQSMVSLAAQDEIANSYLEQEKWQKGVQVLDETIRRYQSGFNVFNLMLKLGSLYEHELGQRQKALYMYQRILNTYPDHEDIPLVYLAKGGLYVSQQKYENARSEFQLILDNYANNADACIQAQLAIGKTYEMENNWNKALNEYQWVVEAFPRHPKALDVPLYIANYYKLKNERNLADAAYETAIKHYKSIVTKYPNTMLSVMALDYLSSSYVRIERWQQAVDALESMLEMKLSHPKRINSSLALAGIYEEKLNNAAKALQIYGGLLEEYPNIPLAHSIEQKTYALKSKVNSYQQYNNPPQQPELLSVREASHSSIELTWRRNSDTDFSHYRIYRAGDSFVDSTDKLVTRISSQEQTNYVDDSVIKDKKYYYRIYAFDNGGLSSASDILTTSGQQISQISAVQLNGYAKGWSTAQLSWSRSAAPDFDCYKIYRSENPDVSLSSRLVKSIYNRETVQFADNGLSENQTYYYRLFVYNRNGDYKAGNTVTITTGQNTPPKQLYLETPIIESSGAVKLRWNQCNDSDFSMYRIYRAEQPKFAADRAPIWMSSSNTANFYTDSDVRPGKTYYYKIVVVDRGGLSTESNEVSINL
ncbi:tetratricopeptide repeat protein [candidate division KSB1 bacterium]|nr:tetratricopeptide repeat protein [candidate division KSB1 bacterium]